MLNPIEQRLYENTQRLLDSNSTEFLTPDEQMFIGQQLNKAILRELENNSSLDAAAVSSLSNLCDWLKNEDLFDLNGLDSSWLRELKGADFSIFFQRKERRQCAYRRNNGSGCGKRPRRFNEREGRKKLSGTEDGASPRASARVATSVGQVEAQVWRRNYHQDRHGRRSRCTRKAVCS